ncbi:lytic polysaccharide monooxygenase auxiliary activity family 9 protein [Acerihabitans sp.]|uniref:lytic polysaccharide monooxygenase auxiliary activity family 9 protein n=1 Tax=Acerihabitans sp. TaxID=2811394 RepID=UPI002ED8BF9B
MSHIDYNQDPNRHDAYRDTVHNSVENYRPDCPQQPPHPYSVKPPCGGIYPEPYPFYQPLDPLTGRVVSPASRAQILLNVNGLEFFTVNQTTGGKNFPDLFAGQVPFPFQEDVESATPPPDNFILSGGNLDQRGRIDFTDAEFANFRPQFSEWPRLRVNPAEALHIQWLIDAPRITRGYRAFITRDNWAQNNRLTRAQIEPAPFFNEINEARPWFAHQSSLPPRLTFNLPLPFNKRGHHVILLLWIIADQPFAFYQAFDVDFG